MISWRPKLELERAAVASAEELDVVEIWRSQETNEAVGWLERNW